MRFWKINLSKYLISFIIEKSRIKKPTFFKKLKEKRFTPEELLIIAENVEPKQWRHETKEEIFESLKRADEEIKNGQTISHEVWVSERNERLKKYKDEADKNIK